MRAIFVLLSPTPGMHQYTADLAASAVYGGLDVHVVTTAIYPSDRYARSTPVHTPVAHRTTGFSSEGLSTGRLSAVVHMVRNLAPDVVHVTGVHLWNPVLIAALRQTGIPTVHTLHDLDPHQGVHHGSLIRCWNRWVTRTATHLLVHAERYRNWLLAQGRSPAEVTALPLVHSFLSSVADQHLQGSSPAGPSEGWALLFGRMERYKGADVLNTAANTLAVQGQPAPFVVAAGAGAKAAFDPVPPGAILLDRRVDDATGWSLFERCACLVLPYTSATQSALPAAAYAFGKPVIVSDSGALPEVVEPGVTGWVVPAGNADALAAQMAVALNDRDRCIEMGKAGRRWYEQRRAEQPGALRRMYEKTIAAGV